MRATDIASRLTQRALARLSLSQPNKTDKFDALLDQEAAAEIRLLLERCETATRALRQILDGPWPNNIEGPVDQCKWDEQVARTTLAALSNTDTRDK